MIPLAVVIPEARLEPSLRPLIVAARARNVTLIYGSPGWDLRVAVGLDGFVPQAEHRVAVDAWFDCWRHPPDPTQIMCYATRYHADTHLAMWSNDAMPSIRRAVVGCLWADGRPLLPDAERDLAVFFTPKMVKERQTRWFRGYYMAALVAAEKAAEREGLTLVIKTRKKHSDPWRLLLGGAQVFKDDTSSLDLLRRARWCVHFGSGAALEACAMGAFAYWYPAPEEYLASSPGSDRRPAMFCYPGVSRMGAPNGSRLDPVARARFLDTYVGSLDGQAANRVLDLAEGL